MKKKISILCFSICLLFCLPLNAQEIDSLGIYSGKQDWNKDIIYYEKAISDFNVNSQNEQELAKLLKQLSYLYLNKGDLIKAEENLLKSYKIIGNVYSKDSEYYIDEIEDVTKFYRFTNDLGKADLYAQIGYEIALKINDDAKYLSFLTIKASITSDLGDYESAYFLYLEGISLAKNIYGEKSILYASLMGNMGDVMIRRNDFENAKRCYLINYLVTYDLYGDNHIETAIMLNKLSNIYIKLDNFKKALELNLRAHQIYIYFTGNSSIEYATSCYNLASTYSFLKDFENSEKYYLESYKIITQIYGSDNTNILNCLKSLIILYDKTNKLPTNSDLLNKYFVLIKQKIEEIESNFSQKELILLTEAITKKNYSPSSFLQNNPTQYPEINIGSYENELLLKNLSLRNQQRVKKSIENSTDVVLKEKYQQFITSKRYLIKLEELPLAKRPYDYQILKTEVENLEKDIARQSTTFANAKKTFSITWKKIQEKLQPNEMVIDLVTYNYYNKKWTDSIMYGAFVIKKGSKFPKYITLFEEKQLKQLLKKESSIIDETRINQQYQSKAVSDLFFKALEPELNDCKTIYLSPSGLVHQINFKALPIKENQTFGEQFNIQLVNSTVSILDYNPDAFSENKKLEIILYGGIDYNKKSMSNSGEELSLNEMNTLGTRSGISEFGYLKGSLNEITSISIQAKQNKFASTVKTDREATEESIKLLDGKKTPYVLHLATHGFFFEEIKQELPTVTFQKIVRSKYTKVLMTQ